MTTATKTFDFQTAMFLPNGAMIVERKSLNDAMIVLANQGGNHVQPYVTWRVDANGIAESGHYFGQKHDAKADFDKRVF